MKTAHSFFALLQGAGAIVLMLLGSFTKDPYCLALGGIFLVSFELGLIRNRLEG